MNQPNTPSRGSAASAAISRPRLIVLATFALIAFWVWGAGNRSTVSANPAWSRKYNAKCSLCHSTYPRLNRTGYEFKRRGYRLPEEVAPPPRQKPLGPDPVVGPVGYVPAPVSPESRRGEIVYGRLDCARCHAIRNLGGSNGPPLDGIGARRDSGFLSAHLTDPEEHARKYPELHGGLPNRMPHPNASPEEIVELVAFLRTLPEPKAGFRVSSHGAHLSDEPPPSGPFTPSQPSEGSRQGERLYFEKGCAACHVVRGSGGGFGPNLDGVGANRSRTFLTGHVTNPAIHAERFPGEHRAAAAMPPTSASPEEIESIVDFLLTLPPAKPTARPKNRISDYFAVSYLPGIEIKRESGTKRVTYENRELVLYAAGPVGRRFAFFVQPVPLSAEPGFFGKFEMMQGMVNVGGDRTFAQFRFGRIFNLRNAGFAGTDRGLTETVPFVFDEGDGFAPARLGRGGAFEVTIAKKTILKAFATLNETAEAEIATEEPGGSSPSRRAKKPKTVETEPTPGFGLSRTFGLAFERIVGDRGLSGVQVQYAGGFTPLSIPGAPGSEIGFRRLAFFANRTFQDSNNRERLNLLGGVANLATRWTPPTSDPLRSNRWGFFVEAAAIPVADHLTVFARYDQLGGRGLFAPGLGRGLACGVILDPVKYGRFSFEYQRLFGDSAGRVPVGRYRIGWQFNF